jgi:hypothetical protein
MTAALTPVPKIQFFADDGTPLVGGKLYSYAAGTTTPLATYTTYAGTVANTNPVILDSRGEANVWLGAGPYKLALYDSVNALIWTVDNITPEGDASLVSYLPAGTGAVATTVQTKLRESVSVQDFGAAGDGITDDTYAFQAAVNYLQTSGSSSMDLHLGALPYRIVGTITISGPVQIIGQGVHDFDSSRPITRPTTGTWLIHANTSGPLFQFNNNLSTGAELRNFGVFQEGHSAPAIGWAPAVRDWVIRNELTQGTLNIKHVHFHNVYKGVLTDYANRPQYENITGQFFYQAFQFDRIYDIGKLDGLHAWTYWSENDYVLQWQQANNVSITLLRADGMWMDRIFTFAVKDGISIGLSAYGGTSRVIYVNGLYCDFTGRAIVINSTSPAHIQIGNMFFLGQAWPTTTPATVLSGAAAIDIVAGSNHLVQIANLFSILSAESMIKVAGTNNQIWIESEVIEQYDRNATGAGAHTVASTNTVKLGSIPSLSKYSGVAAEITGALAGNVVLPVAQKFNATNTINRVVTAGAATGNLAVVTVEGEATAGVALLALTTGIVSVGSATNALSFYGGASAVKGAVTGAKGGNVALANLITYLANRGLLTDSTT